MVCEVGDDRVVEELEGRTALLGAGGAADRHAAASVSAPRALEPAEAV